MQQVGRQRYGGDQLMIRKQMLLSAPCMPPAFVHFSEHPGAGFSLVMVRNRARPQ